MEDYPAMKSREVNHRETTKKKGNNKENMISLNHQKPDALVLTYPPTAIE